MAVPEFLKKFGSLEDKAGDSIVPGTSPGTPLLNGKSDVTRRSWRVPVGVRVVRSDATLSRIDIVARNLFRRWDKYKGV